MAETKNEYALSADEFALIAEYENAIRDLTSQKQGALQLIVRSRKLEGTWSLVGGRLVKQEKKESAK